MLHEKERKAATVTGSIPGVTAPTITYKKGNETLTAAPADAGDYTASITLGEGENAKTASVEYSIEKATPTAENFSFTAPTDLIYNGKAKTAAIAPNTGITGRGDVSVKYDRDGREVQNPTNAGTYTVKIAVIEGTNYATRILWLFSKMAEICATPTKFLCRRAFRLDGLITPTLKAAGSNPVGRTMI